MTRRDPEERVALPDPDISLDTGEGLVLQMLVDRGFDQLKVSRAIHDYDGDIWVDYFNPMLDKIEKDLGLAFGGR